MSKHGLFGVSVPYSSGQWLQPPAEEVLEMTREGFSPLFIGSMAATTAFCLGLTPKLTRFSPLFIGSMAATDFQMFYLWPLIQVSVPYSSGQWLQRYCRERFDPLYGGVSVPYSSGQWLQLHSCAKLSKFFCCFSPLFIGSMAATKEVRKMQVKKMSVSVPYSSGQWLQRNMDAQRKSSFSMSFSPLFIGSMAATYRHYRIGTEHNRVSVPYSSGQWLQPASWRRP